MSSEKSWKVESVDLSTKRTSSYFTVQSSMRKSNRPAGLRVHRPAGLRVHRAAGLRVHRPALLWKFYECMHGSILQYVVGVKVQKRIFCVKCFSAMLYFCCLWIQLDFMLQHTARRHAIEHITMNGYTYTNLLWMCCRLIVHVYSLHSLW